MALKRIDWEEVRKDFIQGYFEPPETDDDDEEYIKQPNFQQIADRHQISYSAVSKKAAAERWMHHRKLYWRKIERQRLAKKLDDLQTEAVKFNLKAIKAANDGVTHILRHFERANERYLIDQKPMDKYTLDALSRALERYQKVGRLSLGQSTENSEQLILKEETIKLESLSAAELDQLERIAEQAALRELTSGPDGDTVEGYFEEIVEDGNSE